MAKYAITVAEFDECLYKEFDDTVFLCGQCNMKCLCKVNGSKIKSKMPIDQYLAQRDDVDDSFLAAAVGLPLLPPSLSDFPELPWAAPIPKMTKAEKAMANKINSLLLSSGKDKAYSPPGKELPKPATTLPVPVTASVSQKIRKQLDTTVEPAGVLPIPAAIREQVFHTVPDQSGAVTPIMAMAAIHTVHTVSCPHETDMCSACQFGITCCKCQVMHTAPAAKRMRCTKCLHWACDYDQTNECCLCGTQWVTPTVIRKPAPASSPLVKPAERLRGGAGSDKAWSDDGSSAHTAQEDTTVKIQIAAPTQESIDEIDALSRPSTVRPPADKGKQRKPKSGQSSREPSCPSSVASELLSVTETVLPKPDIVAPPLAHEYQWSKPPSDLKALPGYIHAAHREKVLQLDDEDPTHFVKRGSIDINALSEELDILLSASTLWKTVYHAITDLFQFDSLLDRGRTLFVSSSAWQGCGTPTPSVNQLRW